MTNCNLAKSHNTDKWNVYWPSSGGGDEDDDDEPEDRDGNDNDNDNENDGGGGNALKKRGVDACVSFTCIHVVRAAFGCLYCLSL